MIVERKNSEPARKQKEGNFSASSMAVENKDDTHPIASKLKGLQENEYGDNGEKENPHNNTDDKENLNGNSNGTSNNNHNHTNNHTNNDNTHITQPDTSTNTGHPPDAEQQTADIEEGVANLGIAEPSNFLVKHPLQNSWTIWYDNPGKRTSVASWGDHLRRITSFDTVEDFWRVFNNLKAASTLQQGSNYHLFKEHIEPKWEDPINSKGGKWTVNVPPKNRTTALDQMWLWTILACIGETINSPDDVCGIVVSIRKAGDRVQIWTRDANNEAACRDIGRSLKETLELPDNVVIGYQSHADSMKKSSSAKNKYEV